MIVDRYTKLVLTLIAAALVLLALNPWLQRVGWDQAVGVRATEAQTPATPSTPPAPTAPRPAAPSGQPIPVPAAGTPWWDDCTIVSTEKAPASWGKLLGLAPGVFVFESDHTIRLVRTAPFEAVTHDPANPSKKPCKILEIKKTS